MTEHHRLHPDEGAEAGEKGLKLGVGLLLLGVVLMVAGRLIGHPHFYGPNSETVDPEVAAGHRLGVTAVPEEAVS